MRGWRNLASTRLSCPGGFLGLPRPPSHRLIALQTRVLAQRRLGGRAHLDGLGRVLGCALLLERKVRVGDHIIWLVKDIGRRAHAVL